MFIVVACRMCCEVIELNIRDDHVNLLVSMPPKESVSKLLGMIKGKTAILPGVHPWPTAGDRVIGIAPHSYKQTIKFNLVVHKVLYICDLREINAI